MNFDIQAVKAKNKEYPVLLKDIYCPPETLYYKGQLPLPDEKLIAIVGTRKATNNGKETAEKIAQELAECGATVVSGLALGIDGAAHKGALLGGGRAVVVLAGGLHSIHPRTNFSLANEIIKNDGCIMSEHEAGIPPLPYRFLERNRIISGLSLAVVVIEAPLRSGSLSTARHALEQGREVFVVPGPAGSFNYAGSHKFIREGARLVTSAREILEDLGFDIMNKKKQELLIENSDIETKKLIEALQKSPGINVGKIAERTKMDIAEINGKLGILVLDGIVKEDRGRFWVNS